MKFYVTLIDDSEETAEADNYEVSGEFIVFYTEHSTSFTIGKVRENVNSYSIRYVKAIRVN